MPLSVEIKINGDHIETLWIGRMEPLRGRNVAHEYLVRVEGKPEHMASFRHTYDEGARECVRHALEALAIQHEKRERRGRR